jgi:FO synthase
VHAEHGHIQEVILQNFVPHQRYYGASRRRSPMRPRASTGARGWPTGPELPLPEWACPVNIEDMKRLIAETGG